MYATNDPVVVDAWLTATALDGDAVVEVDGNEQSLRDALTMSYDICRITPNLTGFVADSCGDTAAARALRSRPDKLDEWLRGRNGLDLVSEFTVRADPQQWQDVLVRLTPRSYSISSSPLVSPHEVQLTVSVVRYRGAEGRCACRRLFGISGRPRGGGPGVPAALAAFPAARGCRARR